MRSTFAVVHGFDSAGLKRYIMTASVFSLMLAATDASAAVINVLVQDAAGQPLADAVVYAESDAAMPRTKGRVVEIEQKGRKFLPLVTVVQSGTQISFPNNDTVRHHIYSFSPAKVFEQKLYSGVPQNPVLFDKAGVVVLGCNIHDQMLAYIQIVDTPYFAKTDSAGKAKIDDAVAGKYKLKVWHFNLPAGEAPPHQAIELKGDDFSASFKLNIKPRSGGEPKTSIKTDAY
ncbi:MAG: methylamine utilization protein [Pseudomonadota bacterium]